MIQRVLIVDSNKAYANIVKESLVTYYINKCNIEVAINGSEIKRRVNENKKYDLIIADTSVSADGEEMNRNLHKLGKEIVIWSTYAKCLKKPIGAIEINRAIPQLVSTIY